MKLRFIPVLLVLLLMSAGVFAQEVLYTEYEKFDFRSGEFSVVGKVGNKLYVYRGSSEGYYLDAYDDNMHRLATVILDFLPRRCYGTKFITYKDRMVVLPSHGKWKCGIVCNCIRHKWSHPEKT